MHIAGATSSLSSETESGWTLGGPRTPPSDTASTVSSGRSSDGRPVAPTSLPSKPPGSLSDTEDRMLFFAKVLRTSTEGEVSALFSRFGHVQTVSLFRAFQGAPMTKGCGLVTMASREEAAQAQAALDGRFVYYGMDAPMVVKWMDAPLQRRRKEQHLASLRQRYVTSGRSKSAAYPPQPLAPRSQPWPQAGPCFPSWPADAAAGTLQQSNVAYLPPPPPRRAAAPGLPPMSMPRGLAAHMGIPGNTYSPPQLPPFMGPPYLALGGPSAQPMALMAQAPDSHDDGPPPSPWGPEPSPTATAADSYPEAPPSGCDPDAVKLFVGNVPRAYGELALLPIFESVGRVAEISVIRDRATQAHKGSAFVWYTSRASAELAISRLSLRHALPDPAGAEPPRPLIVRKAHARQAAAPPARPLLPWEFILLQQHLANSKPSAVAEAAMYGAMQEQLQQQQLTEGMLERQGQQRMQQQQQQMSGPRVQPSPHMQKQQHIWGPSANVAATTAGAEGASWLDCILPKATADSYGLPMAAAGRYGLPTATADGFSLPTAGDGGFRGQEALHILFDSLMKEPAAWHNASSGSGSGGGGGSGGSGGGGGGGGGSGSGSGSGTLLPVEPFRRALSTSSGRTAAAHCLSPLGLPLPLPPRRFSPEP